MASGTIITRIYTSQAQLPLPNATVAFTQKIPGGKHRLLGVRITDQSGKTEPITVETPAQGVGETPGDRQPFAQCDIWIQAPGFETLLVEDVQIFPGTTTVQDIMLVPLPEQSPSCTWSNSFQIAPQDL
ncbi:MAG: spore cortex-lytic protein [Oscillospiraceae bacterium]|nr:spore cortex-lytic protein [Oscillospiraceae bacterium]